MSDDDPTATHLWPAAIEHDGGADMDDRLRAFAHRQRQDGYRVSGLVMTRRAGGAGCQAEMVLTDLDTGSAYLVSQPMGSESTSCRADPQGFARASQVLRDAGLRRPDLVVCNRYGALEAENGGFVAELLALMAQDLPLLTVVAPKHRDAWQRFVGGRGTWLSADPPSWVQWFDEVRRARERAAALATPS